MKKSFEEALKHRRTYYSITNQSPVSDEEIERIVNLAVTHVPSAFNSQSTRVVLLLGENHKKLWHIVKETLRKIVPPEVFKTTEPKSTTLLQADTELFYSSKISRSLRDCRKHSAVIRITSPGGRCRLLRCISWLYGRCWKMSASELLCNITIR